LIADRVAGSAVIARLTALHPKLIDLSTERIERLLRRLGDPHLALSRVVHVAGTNGKGSTVAFVRAGLEAAGLKVNVYTSPHLVRFTERIRLGGHEISEEALLDILERCETANAGQPITFFEILTAAALLAFAESPADATLVEVGLGGRYDATNVFPAPAIAAITPVSIDHVDFLGSALCRIAWEKAGILKTGRPAVVAPQSAEALATIQATAKDVGAHAFYGDIDWRVRAEGPSLRFEDGDVAFDLPRPALAGEWQTVNAGTALATLNRLDGFTLTHETANAALRNAYWPGRLQPLTRGPLVKLLKPRSVWLDGGHNPAAAEALAATLALWPERPRVIAGMLKTKDADSFFKALSGAVRSIETIAVPGAASTLSAGELAGIAAAAGVAARPHASIEAAASAIAAEADAAPVLIAGSLYLAGGVLATHA